jgi:hypothetical protein
MNPAWPHGDPRDVARAIVADPRYAIGETSRPAPPSWLDLLHDWLRGILRGFLHGIDRALGANSPLETVIGFGLLAAALALLAWASYRLVRSYAHGARRVARQNPSPADDLAGVRSAATLREAALAAARGDRYREAAALLFASVLRTLDERGRIPYDPARTPGEYRRLVRDPRFDALAFDAVVALFAAAEPSAELFERLESNCRRFLDAALP